jgi:hypothetical protein
MFLGEFERAAIAGAAGGDRRLEDDSARAHLDDRERVHVAVRVDPDHVIQLICKHPNRPPAMRWGSTTGAGLGIGTARGRTVMSHAPRGGQASDQASKRAPGRHRTLCPDESLEGHAQPRSTAPT